MNILWADLTASAEATVVRRSFTRRRKVGTTIGGRNISATFVVLAFGPAEGALCERGHSLGRDSGQAAEIAGLASPLVTGPARQIRNFRRQAEEPRAAKRLRSYGQRGAIQSHNRHAGRASDMERSTVASDI